MPDYPRSLPEFDRMFATEEACAKYLFALKWPNGFVCPACGHDRYWTLATKAHGLQCTRCEHQTSLKAGTLMEGSKLSLGTWFKAAFLMASHSNGISALQLQSLLGLGSYRSAWMLAMKLRRAMVEPERRPLLGLVEVDDSSLPYRTKADPPAGGQGRSHEGKLLLAGAVELVGRGPGRARLKAIDDYSATTLHAFIRDAVAPGSTVKTDGWSGYPGAPAVSHQPHVVGPMAAHVIFPWIHRVFANFKRWALGVYHGVRRTHLQAYLDEYVFRFNRRSERMAAFRSVLVIGSRCQAATYKMLIGQEARA